MKIILNTALNPYFVATDTAFGWEISTWDQNRLTSEVVWNHLQQKGLGTAKSISFVGISGTGSFTNLRFTSVVAEAIRLKPKSNIRLLITPKLAAIALDGSTSFLFPAYGPHVFLSDGETKTLYLLEDIPPNQNVRKDFIDPKKFAPENWTENILNSVWENAVEVSRFNPDYFFPSVQT